MEIPLTALAVALAGLAPFSTYICSDGTSFTLSASSEMAIVRFPDVEYRLPRRRSSIAIKYATERATLYLDGDLAAFVSDDRWPPGCRRVRVCIVPFDHGFQQLNNFIDDIFNYICLF